MKPYIYWILYFLISILLVEPVVIKLNSEPELFAVDKLGNCYVYHNYQLEKYSIQGKLVGQFSSLELGKLESIDTSDPMQIMLFFKDFNQLIFLDNRMSVKGSPIYFDDLNLNSVSVVCKSKQMAVWVYDEYENKLIQFGFNPRRIIHTINFASFSEELDSINFILENGNELYMNQNNKAVWVLDQFGNRLNKLAIRTNRGFQVSNRNILYNNSTQLYSMNLDNESISPLKVDGFGRFDDVRVSKNHFYVLNSDSITILERKKVSGNF